MSIEKLKANYPVRTRWVHFPLHPETPAEGRSLAELFPGRDLTPMRERMQTLMQEAGLAYADRAYTYNSRLAQELGKWADTQPGGEAIHDLLYRAYFADSINIGAIDELLKIAAAAGLDAEEAKRILQTRAFEAAVDEDWQRARQMGITGVPTFYSHELVVVGCQPYEMLERFVKHLLELEELEQQASSGS